MNHSYLPVGVALTGRKCLVVGGGKVALRKLETLLEFGAAVTVIAPEPDERIEFYASRKLLDLVRRKYQSPEASQYDLVISASGDDGVNNEVGSDCNRSGTLVNVVDNPALCSFIFPAVVKRDALTVAVSTSGRAPFLAGRLRLILEDVFPQHWTRIVELAGSFREKVRQSYPAKPETRAQRYNAFLDMNWKAILAESADKDIEAMLDKLVESDIEGTTGIDITPQDEDTRLDGVK